MVRPNSGAEDKVPDFPKITAGEEGEALPAKPPDPPFVPAPPWQFHISNLQQWIDLCA
jgi:hypothetical protein